MRGSWAPRSPGHWPATPCGSHSWRLRTTSATVRRRPTPPSCTPVSTPCPAPWKRGSYARGTGCCPRTRRRPAFPWSRWAPSSWPGTRSSAPPSPPRGEGGAQRTSHHPTAHRRRTPRARASLGSWRPRRARSSGRVGGLPVDDHPRVRHAGGPLRGRAASQLPRGEGPSGRSVPPSRHPARGAADPPSRQRLRAPRRCLRRAGRPRGLHRHSAPGPVAGLRQVRPRPGPAHPAPRTGPARQGRAHRADRVRERHARAHRRGPGRQDRHRHDGGRARRAPRAGRPHPPRAARRGGHGRLRGPSGRHRAGGLPDRRAPGSPVRDGGRDPFHRAHRLPGHRRARPRAARRLRARPGARTAARPAPHAEPRRGLPRPYRDARLIAREPDFGSIVCHCERVTRGEIRAALTSTIPPGGLDGLRRRTRARGGRCQGHYCSAEVRAVFEEYGEGAR